MTSEIILYGIMAVAIIFILITVVLDKNEQIGSGFRNYGPEVR